MSQQKKRRPQQTGRFLNILILVFTVLVVFEGRLIVSILSKGSLQKQVEEQLDEVFSAEEFQTEAQTEDPASQTENTPVSPENLVEFPDVPSDPCVVPAQSTPVDDSYFSDAVFIGDSRVEGFHIQSGITQGTFLTGVGMDSSNIFEKQYITSVSGNITVYQALYNNSFKKMYIMLGTNELGYPDFEEFRKNYKLCLGELRKMMPDALFYVSAVPYVEEAKVETGAYVNNTNIDTVNQIIFEICQENNYYYLNPNEVLSDGHGSLAQDATSDGIHMYAEYCTKWLNYLKTHYVVDDVLGNTTPAESEDSSEAAETESESQSLSESTDAAKE